MPELITEVTQALFYSVLRGLPFDRYTDLLTRAGRQASATGGALPEIVRMDGPGRGNLGLSCLEYGNVSLLEKRTVNVAEYLVCKALSDARTCEHNARIYTTGARGPVFYIYQELAPLSGDAITQEQHAEMVLGFSRDAASCLNEIAPSRASHYTAMRRPSFLRALSGLTEDPPARLERGLNEIIQGRWRIQHNDLHTANIRRRASGDPVMIDMGSVAWNLEGGDFSWLVPDGRIDPGATAHFKAVTDIAGELLGKHGSRLRKAALLCAAARHLRRARRHRNKARALMAARIVADALSLQV